MNSKICGRIPNGKVIHSGRVSAHKLISPDNIFYMVKKIRPQNDEISLPYGLKTTSKKEESKIRLML